MTVPRRGELWSRSLPLARLSTHTQSGAPCEQSHKEDSRPRCLTKERNAKRHAPTQVSRSPKSPLIALGRQWPTHTQAYRKLTGSHPSSEQVKAPSATDPNAPKVPKSFVVKSGTVGGSVAQLTKDVRKVLEPNTATRLKERKANRLRDYVSMSGPLGVTHLAVFSQPPTSTAPVVAAEKPRANETAEERAERSLIEGTTTVNLRLIRLPRGPTLSFKVLRYSLASDVLRMARRPRAVGREFAEAPLVSTLP